MAEAQGYEDGLAGLEGATESLNTWPLHAYCNGVTVLNGTDECYGSIACYFPDENEIVTRRVSREDGNVRLTCNRVDYLAALQAIKFANKVDPEKKRKLCIFTGNMTLVDSMDKWVTKWEEQGWRKRNNKPVENQDILKAILQQGADRVIKWAHAAKNDVGLIEAKKAARHLISLQDDEDNDINSSEQELGFIFNQVFNSAKNDEDKDADIIEQDLGLLHNEGLIVATKAPSQPTTLQDDEDNDADRDFEFLLIDVKETALVATTLEPASQACERDSPEGDFDHIESMATDLCMYSQWFIPRGEIEFDSTPLVTGRYTSIHHGTWRGASVVIKTLQVNEPKIRRSFLDIVKIWHKLQHPHIAQFLGACDDNKPFVVCEDASNGSLSEYLTLKKNRAHKWTRLYEAALALEYLHNKHNLVHGDLTCGNILVGKDKTTKLAGFGSSFAFVATEWNGKVDIGVDTIRWKAPELLQNISCGLFASDVYSLGMCIIEAVTGRQPWENMGNAAVKEQVLKKNLPNRPDDLSNEQWTLVKQMCSWMPSIRPDIVTVVSRLKAFADEELKAKMLQKQNVMTQKVASRRRQSERPVWFVDETQVEITSKPFNNGSFGSIHRGKYAGAEVVVKRLVQGNIPSEREMLSFINEAEVWHQLNHPHIIRLYGACDISDPAFFVCESAITHGNLEDYLFVHDKEKKTIWRLFHQAALGLLYLHQQGIVHGNLKCNNILVGDDYIAKLSDFGLSFIRIESKKMSKQGAIAWMAPECLSGAVENPTYASDVYSLAMCIIEAFKEQHPWGTMLDVAITRRVKEGYLPARPKNISDQAWELVIKMCTNDPVKRISLTEVIEQLRVIADVEQDAEIDVHEMTESFRSLSDIGDSVSSSEDKRDDSSGCIICGSPVLPGKQYCASCINVFRHSMPSEMLPIWFIPRHRVMFDRAKKVTERQSRTKVFVGTLEQDSSINVWCISPKKMYERKILINQIDLWFMLNHPHVLRLFGAWHIELPMLCVCEHAAYENMSHFLSKGQNHELLWMVLYETALGLQYLHSQRIVHGDIRCDNIVVGVDGKTKLCNFGFTYRRRGASVHNANAPKREIRWMAPERINGDDMFEPLFESDIYEFG